MCRRITERKPGAFSTDFGLPEARRVVGEYFVCETSPRELRSTNDELQLFVRKIKLYFLSEGPINSYTPPSSPQDEPNSPAVPDANVFVLLPQKYPSFWSFPWIIFISLFLYFRYSTWGGLVNVHTYINMCDRSVLKANNLQTGHVERILLNREYWRVRALNLRSGRRNSP